MYDYKPNNSNYDGTPSGYNINNEIYSDEAYKEAERRVRAKMIFYGNLISFLTVSGLLAIVYFLTSLAHGELYYPWLIWPIGFWSIGLVSHFIKIFVIKDGATTRRKMVEDEMRKMGVPFQAHHYTQSNEK